MGRATNRRWQMWLVASVIVASIAGYYGLRGRLSTGIKAEIQPESLEQIRAVLGQPDFGMFSLYVHPEKRPTGTWERVKWEIRRLTDRVDRNGRTPQLKSASFRDLRELYSSLTEKPVCFGQSLLNYKQTFSFDPAAYRTKRQATRALCEMLETNNILSFDIHTNIVLMTRSEFDVFREALQSRSSEAAREDGSLFQEFAFPKPAARDLTSAVTTEAAKAQLSYGLPGTNAPISALMNFALSNELLQTTDRKLFIAKELNRVMIGYPANTSCKGITFFRTLSEILRTNGIEMLDRGQSVWIYPKSKAKRYRREIDSSNSL